MKPTNSFSRLAAAAVLIGAAMTGCTGNPAHDSEEIESPRCKGFAQEQASLVKIRKHAFSNMINQASDAFGSGNDKRGHEILDEVQKFANDAEKRDLEIDDGLRDWGCSPGQFERRVAEILNAPRP
ncbi:MAG: hypothetical protein KDJ15_00060 [Alphaproteobacteria bacterium]|nr:hypothetical protein [Alphaproteobacteria bacterium]